MTPTASNSLSHTIHAVFLDRDGVINRKLPEGCYITRREEFELLDGVADSIARLNRAGLLVIVVTNQRGIARKRMTLDTLNTVHAALQNELAASGAHLDSIFVCPHGKDECDCRKPLPGLFHQAQARFPQIEAATSVMIGDSLSDIEFGRNLGMATICVQPETEHPSPGADMAAAIADFCAPSLPDAVDKLLNLFLH
ncbi:MAG: HAD family hydrolase [Terracidiphilus sp.]|nr:HAD family hydrolase [Terracidiphilus sp.]